MNAPLRRLAAVVVMLFASLFASSTFIQFFDAGALNKRPDNVRTLYKEFGRQRGPIVVAGQEVARSVPSNDRYKYLRSYSGGELYAPITGFYSVKYGETGIESTESDLLAGTADQLFYRRVSDLLTGRQPQGATVELTIDPKLQKIAWDAMGDQRGAVVALDPKTGNILAMVSKPSFDANLLAGHDSTKVTAARQQLLDDPNRPMDNRALGALYPPGSTFKLITAAAALAQGNLTPDSQIPGPASVQLPLSNRRLANDTNAPCGGGDQSTLTQALTQSCNTSFALLGQSVGADALRKQAEAFGFDSDQLRIPLRVARSTFPTAPDAAQTELSSIGQFDVAATPLQMAMVSAAIANDGVLMKPNLVARVRSADNLDVIQSATPNELGRPISSQVAGELRTMMLSVVTSGTGTAAQIDGVDVAGKTGTAQSAEGKPPHAWFTAFASGNGRNIAIAVVVEYGGKAGNEAFGGTVAAPIARKVMEAVVR
ncbi:MAG TPA: penicillin-binding transpeptidase domain-containing protein [Kineosporiaceae bacterium]